jgi:NAD(P)H-dependent flavin oxidoreductase YrpB (nitropropane dioxygenase family)
MTSQIKELTGVDFPLFAFSHCRDVVAAVSRAGGFGVLGASGSTPEALEAELEWIVRHTDGKPFGVDVLIPENYAFSTRLSVDELVERIPARHRDFTIDLLGSHGVALDADAAVDRGPQSLSPEYGGQLLEVAFRYPIRLIANALGIAPPIMLEMGKAHGVPVAALVGSKDHAVRQVEAGVDIIVAQGGEAGGHCGEVSTLVLVPEVVRATRAIRDVPVLAAGGIMTGEQMAGCMAMGAAGAWTGSIWLATVEAETSEAIRDRLVAASSRDTVRSKARTGKYSRQLRSAWHDAWEGQDSPGALPMPLMNMLSRPAFAAIEREAAKNNPEARKLVSYFVGQGVGLIDEVRGSASVVQQFKEEFAGAVEALLGAVGD